MSDRVDAQMLADWRINYNLVGRTPADAMCWWNEKMDGKAPAGAVAALGLCINEIERLTAENKMLRHTHRWNVSPQTDDSLLVCRHLHEKDEKCDLEHYVPAGRLHDAIRERDELRRQLAEAELDAQRYRWLRIQPNDTAAPRIDVVYWTPADESANDGEGLRLTELDAAIDAAMGLTRPAEES